MSVSRVRELWRDRKTGEAWLVETEGGRVVSANGPVGEDEVGNDALAYKHAAQGRSPAFTETAAELDRRRDEFERKRLDAPD